MRRESSLTLAMKSQACALSIVASKSFARRRFRLSQAMVRSTTQRRGSGSKPMAASDRLTTKSNAYMFMTTMRGVRIRVG
jgi:hypothetical protein